VNAYLRNFVRAVMIVWLSVCLTGHAQTTAPQPVVLNAHSSVDEILQALYQRGQNLQDFTASVTKTDADPVMEKENSHLGTIRYQRQTGDNVRIRVTFEHEKLGDNKVMAFHEEDELSDGKLVVQHYSSKLEDHFVVAKPGQKVNPLRLGEGAFPLPVGQEPQAVKKEFDVKLVPPDKDDPPHTIHAQLVPKNGTRLASKFKTVDVWVDTQTNFTPRIKTGDTQGTKITTTELTNLKINSGLTDKDFQLPPPGPDWAVKTEDLGD
jgi:outer membrane lipoprotein-sorting protein